MCKISGCSKPAVANGLCAMHYMRVRRTGDATVTQKPGPKPQPATTVATPSSARELRGENAELRRQLKMAQARAEVVARALAKANAKAVSIAKADHRKMQKVFFPDAEAKVSAARKKELTEAFQIFSAIRFNIRD